MVASLDARQNAVFVTQIMFSSMYAILAWDWITSARKEWYYIWHTKWTPIKTIYLLTRYWLIGVVPYLLYEFCVDHTMEECHLFKIPVALMTWNQLAALGILIHRTYTFMWRNKFLLASLLAALAGVFGYQYFVVFNEIALLPFTEAPFDMGPCLFTYKTHRAHLVGYFTAPWLLMVILTGLTIGKAVIMCRRSGPSSHIMDTFHKEGLFYFIVISIVNLVTVILCLQPREELLTIGVPLAMVLGPTLTCGLLLDIRELSADRHNHYSSQPSSTPGTTRLPPVSVGHHVPASVVRTRNDVEFSPGRLSPESAIPFDSHADDLYDPKKEHGMEGNYREVDMRRLTQSPIRTPQSMNLGIRVDVQMTTEER
ncbi:hypothetical protein OF83DRAFT_53468 [Amylostereum chailletii]|nr:hypothetical protein OF83DRAFT_53468 [Amylostereum chailletii]